MIVVVTATRDLHALVIQSKIRESGYHDCYIIESDRIAQREFLSFGINYSIADKLLASDGEPIALSDANVLWLRRPRANQLLDLPLADDRAQRIVHNDCRGGLTGYLSTHFKGKWISPPQATYEAADKLFQLKVAEKCGFRVPKTLVSQRKSEVIDFFEYCGGEIIVKTIVGAPEPFLKTIRINDPGSLDDDSVRAAPAIYQECIPGTDHLRLTCFGNQSFGALIEAEELDWRTNLNVPISSYCIPSNLHKKILVVLDYLGLEMGAIDIKLTPDGEPVWLEVNPQGQFLFLDPLTDLDLATKFADYLISVAKHQCNEPNSFRIATGAIGKDSSTQVW